MPPPPAPGPAPARRRSPARRGGGAPARPSRCRSSAACNTAFCSTPPESATASARPASTSARATCAKAAASLSWNIAAAVIHRHVPPLRPGPDTSAPGRSRRQHTANGHERTGPPALGRRRLQRHPGLALVAHPPGRDAQRERESVEQPPRRRRKRRVDPAATAWRNSITRAVRHQRVRQIRQPGRIEPHQQHCARARGWPRRRRRAAPVSASRPARTRRSRPPAPRRPRSCRPAPSPSPSSMIPATLPPSRAQPFSPITLARCAWWCCTRTSGSPIASPACVAR